MIEAVVTINVRFFAAARDAAGVSDVTLRARPGATVADVFATLAATYPALAPLLARSRAAVNQAYVSSDQNLIDGDELAVIPPVSGG